MQFYLGINKNISLNHKVNPNGSISFLNLIPTDQAHRDFLDSNIGFWPANFFTQENLPVAQVFINLLTVGLKRKKTDGTQQNAVSDEEGIYQELFDEPKFLLSDFKPVEYDEEGNEHINEEASGVMVIYPIPVEIKHYAQPALDPYDEDNGNLSIFEGSLNKAAFELECNYPRFDEDNFPIFDEATRLESIWRPYSKETIIQAAQTDELVLIQAGFLGGNLHLFFARVFDLDWEEPKQSLNQNLTPIGFLTAQEIVDGFEFPNLYNQLLFSIHQMMTGEEIKLPEVEHALPEKSVSPESAQKPAGNILGI